MATYDFISAQGMFFLSLNGILLNFFSIEQVVKALELMIKDILLLAGENLKFKSHDSGNLVKLSDW